jgi:hypothetical protein
LFYKCLRGGECGEVALVEDEDKDRRGDGVEALERESDGRSMQGSERGKRAVEGGRNSG